MASLKDLIKKVGQYFDPSSNGGQNFWSSQPAQGLANIQQTNPLNIFSQAGRDFNAQRTQNLLNVRQPGATGYAANVMGNISQNFIQEPTTNFQQLVGGAKQLYGGLRDAALTPSSDAKTKLLQMANAGQGAAKTLVNTGELALVNNPLVAGLKIGTSLIPQQNRPKPLGIDLAQLPVEIAKFSGNRAWGVTEPYIGALPKLAGSVRNKVVAKIATSLLKDVQGGINGLAYSWVDLPEDATPEQKKAALTSGAIFGAGVSAGTQALGGLVGVTKNKLQNSKVAADVYDYLRELVRSTASTRGLQRGSTTLVAPKTLGDIQAKSQGFKSDAAAQGSDYEKLLAAHPDMAGAGKNIKPGFVLKPPTAPQGAGDIAPKTVLKGGAFLTPEGKLIQVGNGEHEMVAAELLRKKPSVLLAGKLNPKTGFYDMVPSQATSATQDLMNKGNIRVRNGFTANQLNIDITGSPTRQQLSKLQELGGKNKIYFDIRNTNGDIVKSGYSENIDKFISENTTPPGFQKGAINFGEMFNLFKGGDKKTAKIVAPSTAPTGRVVDQTLKTKKFNITSSEANTIKNIQKTLGLDTRRVKTFADMQRVAQELGSDPNQLLRDVQTGRITSDEVVALSNVVNTSAQRITSLTNKLKSNPNDPAIQAAITKEEALLNKAVAKQLKGGTEAGRAVVAFRVLANKTLDPAYWLGKAQREAGKPLTPEAISAIQQLTKNKDRLGLAKFVSTLGESTGIEKAVNLWKAGLLTGVPTHVANMTSNTGIGAMETVKDVPATVFDIARSAITGQPRSKSFSLGEITQQVPGAIRGMKMAKDYLKTGIDPNDINKFEAFRGVRYGNTKGGRLAQKYVDGVYRLLGGEDKIFREAAFNRSLFEQANTEGVNKGLNNQQITSLFKNPTPQMVELAKNDSLYTTFNKDNVFASGINALKRKLLSNDTVGGNVAYGAIESGAPFVRTPANVAETLFDYLPTGIIKTTAQKIVNNQSVSNRELADAFGRSATGTSIVALGAALAKAGKLTGNSPTNPTERAQWDVQNKRPNSVLINGKWVPFVRISPFGNLLTVGAESVRNGGSALATSASALKSLTDQPFLLGLSNQLQALTDPARGAQKYVNSAISGFVPSLVASAARGGDTVVRSPKGLVDSVKARIPGLRQQVPAKVTPLGETIPQEGGYLGTMINPFNPTTPTHQNDPIVQEMNRVGYNLNYVGDSVGGTKLTPSQQQAYQVEAGKQIKQALPKLIESKAYKSADIDMQKSLIEKAVNKAKDTARSVIKTNKFPESRLEQSSGIVPSAYAAESTSSTPTTNTTGQVYNFVDSKGAFKTIDFSQPLASYAPTGNTELDKKLSSKYSAAITKRENDIVTLWENKQIDQSTAEQMLRDLKQTKTSLKMSKPKTIKAKKVKVAKLKLTKSKPIKIKIKKIAKPKLTLKTRKLTGY